jgi:5'-nucleotidase
MQRRAFIKNAGAMAMATGVIGPNVLTLGQSTTLTIFHTNDLHNCFNKTTHAWVPDPTANHPLFEKIKNLRQAFPNALLLDAGDFCDQHMTVTIEPLMIFSQMKALGYDAVTLGNNELALGSERLRSLLQASKLTALASNNSLETKPYQVFQRGNLRFGVLGIGSTVKASAKTEIEKANLLAKQLRKEERVDYVIALSHLGYWHPDEQRLSDLQLAEASSGIDLIIGGQTHTYLEEPTQVKNAHGGHVYVKHAGCDGNMLGQVDIQFFNDGRLPELNCKNNVLEFS